MWDRQKGNKFMSIEEVSAERFAQLFHHYHQALGDDSGNAARVRTCDLGAALALRPDASVAGNRAA